MTTEVCVEGIDPDTNFIGLVGSMDAPVINDFIAGFRHGVRSIDETLEVQVLYAGDFGDPAKGKELASSLIENGADIVYNVAALTGQGVLLAAEETGHYSIGVDSDQCDIQPGSILASMMKRFENTVYLTVEKFFNDELKGGEIYSYGLANGGVELRFCPQTADIVPDDLVADIEAAREQIISGELKVDSNFEE
jgi:basic membrane protein A